MFLIDVAMPTGEEGFEVGDAESLAYEACLCCVHVGVCYICCPLLCGECAASQVDCNVEAENKISRWWDVCR